jgi:hypothetical protein
MRDYKQIWKTLAKVKQTEAKDVFIYNIFKAMTAKNPNKLEVALNLLQRAFTPVTKPIKLKNGRRPYDRISRLYGVLRIDVKDLPNLYNPPTRLRDCVETVEEIKMYNDIKDKVCQELDKHSDDLYTFIFVRQDLNKEIQVVQSSHAALVLGHKLKEHDPHKLNFVICGAKDLTELNDIKNHIACEGIETVEFTEPDLNNEITAIASFPMTVSKKRCMRRYKILKYN